MSRLDRVKPKTLNAGNSDSAAIAAGFKVQGVGEEPIGSAARGGAGARDALQLVARTAPHIRDGTKGSRVKRGERTAEAKEMRNKLKSPHNLRR
jgi:hypothetical protein